MPKATKKEQGLYKFPEGEYYPAVLVDVEEKEVPYFKKDKSGNRTNEQAVFVKWVWKFEIADGQFKGEWGYGETTAEYTNREDNLVRQWGETLLGRELDLGEEFDTDKITGLPCMISFRNDEPRRKNDGTLFYPSPVDEVLPRSGGLDVNPPF